MSKRILIIGAGGHGHVVADILQRAARRGALLAPIGYLDDNQALCGQRLLGLPVLGALDELARVSCDALVLAIGDNLLRAQLFHRLATKGYRFAQAIHPDAVVAPSAELGQGCVICANAVIGVGATIGANVLVNTAATVDHQNRVGDHAHIAPGVHLGGDVYIGEGSLIGIGAIVLSQRQIGAWSVVGAGSLVTRDLPDRVVAFGSPARVLRPSSD